MLHHTKKTLIDIDNKIQNQMYSANFPPPPGFGPYANPFLQTSGYVYGPVFSAPTYTYGGSQVVPMIYAPAAVTVTSKPMLTQMPSVKPSSINTLTFGPSTRAPAFTKAPSSSSSASPIMSIVLCCCVMCVVIATRLRK